MRFACPGAQGRQRDLVIISPGVYARLSQGPICVHCHAGVGRQFQRAATAAHQVHENFVPHAHNLYLAYATELGLPGLAAFLVLEARFMRSCLLSLRAWRGQLGWAAAGLVSAMLGFLVYGLTDAIGPGARAGLVLWIGLGLGAALPRATLK